MRGSGRPRILPATGDYLGASPLAARARRYLHDNLDLAGCVPIASWGDDDWLLFDPRGRVRGEPGYVAAIGVDLVSFVDLGAVFLWLEAVARDVLGTN